MPGAYLQKGAARIQQVLHTDKLVSKQVPDHHHLVCQAAALPALSKSFSL